MKEITPSEINGRVKAPPSKSAMIRAVAAALLADGASVIINPSLCDDAMDALSIARVLGGVFFNGKNRILMNGRKGSLQSLTPVEFINCGESGLCIRMFPPIAALAGHECVLGGRGSLKKRPVGMVESLSGFGVTCGTRQGYPPISIKGRLRGAVAEIDGSTSSQFLTGLLMALPLCDDDSRIRVRNLASRPYIDMTVAMAERFGINIDHDENMAAFEIPGGQHYRATRVVIEGDWSGASFLLVAGATAGSVTVGGLDMNSCQADRAILSALDAAGAVCRIAEGSVTVEKNRLDPFEFDAKDCPDLVPPLVALASRCRGKSTIYGTGRLRYKESDRAGALALQFGLMGVAVNVGPDMIEIQGSRSTEAVINPHGDHRIAMSCAVAALTGSGGVTITDPACVAKSYGNFFEDLESIRSDHE